MVGKGQDHMNISDAWGNVLLGIGWFVLIYMILVISFYTILLVISMFQLRKSYQLDDWEPYEELLHLSQTKPVSMILFAASSILSTPRSVNV